MVRRAPSRSRRPRRSRPTESPRVAPPTEDAPVAGGPGRLVLVATPIGNLGDLAPRAEQALAEADLVACEDTRRCRQLLSARGLSARTVSLHEHNERLRVPRLLAELRAGRTVAVTSDAGTPLLSDPGFVLVRQAIAAGIAVESIPGPSALLAGLVVSGLPPYPFTFAGFPPPRPGRRRAFYRRFATLDHTLVFFESPHRLLKSLADAVGELGSDRPAALARELTKLHEEVLRGGLGEVLAEVERRGGVRGEVVIVVGVSGKGGDHPADDPSPDEPAC